MGWVKHLRASAGVIALAFVASSCSISNPVVGPPSPQQGSPPAASHQTTGSTPGATHAPGTTSTGTVSTTGTGVPPSSAYEDDGSVGAMAKTFLRSSPATSLTLEIDWVSGRDPSASALDHLSTILNRECDKPGGIEIRKSDQISAGQSSWTVEDLLALEQRYRSYHSGGSRATIWMVYVDGSFGPNQDALAVSFSASAAAVFRDKLQDASSSLVSESSIERSVITHEMGHLLALVNIGYHSKYNHEDPQHPHHSNDKNSVMYWAVEDISIRTILHGGPPDDFDTYDRADLAMLRGN